MQPSKIGKIKSCYGLQQGVISEYGQGLSTDSQCIDQELHNLVLYNLRKL